MAGDWDIFGLDRLFDLSVYLVIFLSSLGADFNLRFFCIYPRTPEVRGVGF